MTIEAADAGIVHPARLLEYNKMGFKLVGLGKDSKPTISWTPIYEDPNYWTDEKLVQEAWKFKYGVATIFGETRLSDEQGPLHLNDLDVDSDTVHDLLFILQNPGIKYS